MDQYPVLRLSAPHRHQQCLQDNICRLAALHRPADDATGVEIDHNGQIGEAFLRSDVGDVRHSDPVRHLHVELSVQRVVDDHGRLAAIATRPASVADPGFDAGNQAVLRFLTRRRNYI